MTTTASQVSLEIEEWARTDPKRNEWEHAYYFDTYLDRFQDRLEGRGETIELPSGKAEYVDIETFTGDNSSLLVFTVGDQRFALQGSYSSWGTDWDGIVEVEQETVTITRWTTV